MFVRIGKLILFVVWFLVSVFALSGTPAVARPAMQDTTITIPTDLKPITPTNATQLAEVAQSNVSNSADLTKITLADPYLADNAWFLSAALSEPGQGVVVSSSGRIAIGAGSQIKIIDSLHDLVNKKVAMTFKVDAPDIQDFVFSPDGKILAVFSLEQITVWDVSTKKAAQVRTFKIPTSATGETHFTNGRVMNQDGSLIAVPTGSFEAAQDQDYGTYVFNLATGETVVLSGCKTGCGIGAFSPDGKLFAASLPSSPDGTSIQFWSLPDGKALNIVKLNTFQTIKSITFNPDGSLLAVSTSEGLFLMSSTQYQTVAHPTQGNQAYSLLSFSPDGLFLLSKADDGSVHFFGTNVDGGVLHMPPTLTPAPTTVPSAATPTETEAATTCTISAPQSANLRSGPGTSFGRAGSIGAGQTATADAQNTASDGKTWYRLTTGGWVRNDVIHADASCASLPQADS